MWEWWNILKRTAEKVSANGWRWIFLQPWRRRYYIQSAFAIPDQDKMEQEQNSLIRIDDSFKKIIVVKDKINLWRNEKGI